MKKMSICVPLFFIAIIIASCGNKNNAAQEYYDKGVALVVKDRNWNEGGEALLHSLSLQDETQPTVQLAMTYNYLSLVYWNQDFNQKAIDYALKATECAAKLNNDTIRMRTLNRLAASYYLAEKNDSAIICYERALEHALVKSDSSAIVKAYNNIGAVKISEAKPDDALALFEKGIEYANPTRGDLFTYYYNRSRCFQNKAQWDSCSVNISRALDYIAANDLEGKQKLYRRLYQANKNTGNLSSAIIDVDSALLLSDSLFRVRQREELRDITEKYQREKYETELELQRTHWVLIVADVILVFAFVVAFIMHRNRKRMRQMQERMSNLKIQADRAERAREIALSQPSSPSSSSSLSSSSLCPSNEWTEEKEESLSQLYIEQFKLARDMFRSNSAYNKLRQLKYRTDKNYLSDEERLPLIDSVIEAFIDQLSKLRSHYPDLTEDECIYALLSFVGCNNATISMLTKTTEATLRKRRSRFKQKTTENVFMLLMSGE